MGNPHVRVLINWEASCAVSSIVYACMSVLLPSGTTMGSAVLSVFIILPLLLLTPLSHAAGTTLKHVNTVSDHKAWKKLLKTKTNILTLFANGEKNAESFLPVFEKVAYEIRGTGTLVFVDCKSKDGKKLCRNLKVKPALFELKHYKDGSFHKDYDRLLQEKSMISFMQNPAADPPWSEDPTADSVRHIEGPSDFEKLLRKERKPILTMFYAPWCGHCKRLKPEFAGAAEELKGEAVLAGMDVDTPDSYGVRTALNISGFPTIIYFKNGQKLLDYAGGRDKDGIVEWMRNPRSAEEMPQPESSEPAWSETESDVVHLTMDTFDEFISENPSVLVMFYAPWCGHCKAMKPEYTEAATALKGDAVSGVLAAVDATAETALAERYNVKGYPVVKYFGGGQLRYDYGYGRTKDDLVEFMMEPKEPPPPEKDWTEMESEVTHLTEEDFKPFLKKKKHALVMFYAPWCGHCKAAKPEFMSAAEQFSDDKKMAFAALDCTQFQSVCSQHEVSGYPTFKYFNFGKRHLRYMGGRMEADFVEFMSNPSSIKDEL